jgi:ferrous iron transport protein A
MTAIPGSKDISVVLVVCSSACDEQTFSTRSRATTETGQVIEAVALTSLSDVASIGNARACLPDKEIGTRASHPGLDRIARDVMKCGGYNGVEVGSCRDGYSSVKEAIEYAVVGGVRRIMVMPIALPLLQSSLCEQCAGNSPNGLTHLLTQIQRQHPSISIVYAKSPFDHEHLVDRILSVIREYEPATFKSGVSHLNDLAAGETGMVQELDGGTQFRSRMASLGFTPGAAVKMVQNYGHGAVIVSLRGTRVALGRGEARKVGVSHRTDH